MITLYGFPPSGNAMKVRLALELLGLAFEEIVPKGGAHKRAPFTDLNPLGQVPVLIDGDLVLRDSQAILVYLAARYRPGDWDGRDPGERGRIAQWLSFAANEIHHGPNALRKSVLFGAAIDRDVATAMTDRVFGIVEAHLDGRDWLEAGRLTIADLACAPYLALAPQGGVDLAAYARVRAWLDRVSATPGFALGVDWRALPQD
jgi:glutathione S-transferase